MTLVVDRFPTAIARAAVTTSTIAVVAFLTIVAWQGFHLATLVVDQPSPALRIPMVWPYLVIPVGALFMMTQVLATVLERDDAPARQDSATPQNSG